MLNQIQIAPPPLASWLDGSNPPQLAGKACEQVTAGLHGKYFTQCYRGNVFIGSTPAAGVVLSSYQTTSQQFFLWNPAGSGKNIVPIKLQCGVKAVAAGTIGLGLSYILNTGTQVATGSAFQSLPTVTPVNAYLGNSRKSIGLFFTANTAITTAPTFLRSIGVNEFMASSPGAANNYWQLTEYYDGEMILGPGTMIAVIIGTAGSIFSTWDVSLMWEEVTP